jgi:hypothetical protein
MSRLIVKKTRLHALTFQAYLLRSRRAHVCMEYSLKYDKQDHQGKATFNEHIPRPTQQQESVARSPGGSQLKTGKGIRQSTGRQTTI